MQYKTIILGVLEQRPQMHNALRKSRQMLPMMEQLALVLKTRHDAWKERLSQIWSGRDESQIASEALEMALADLEEALPNELRSDKDRPLSLDQAMEFLRRPLPNT